MIGSAGPDVIPVYGAPSPARWMRTRVSKKYRSASSFASGPFALTATVFLNNSRISRSSSFFTHLSTGVTSPFSRAAFAVMTTGPSMVSQWAPTTWGTVQIVINTADENNRFDQYALTFIVNLLRPVFNGL